MLDKHIEELIETLDEQYKTYKLYLTKIESLKEIGYKVYRDSNGKHKLVENKDHLREVFGGAFRKI